MSRLHVERLHMAELERFGRLTRVDTAKAWSGIVEVETDLQERIATFLVPSASRKDMVHMACVHFDYAVAACSCEAFKDYRNAASMPYRDRDNALYVERELRKMGYDLDPLITRFPRSLCPHLRRVRKWLQRHGIWPAIQESELRLIQFATEAHRRAC